MSALAAKARSLADLDSAVFDDLPDAENSLDARIVADLLQVSAEAQNQQCLLLVKPRLVELMFEVVDDDVGALRREGRLLGVDTSTDDNVRIRGEILRS